MPSIDWEVVNRKREEAERQELAIAIGQLKSQVALLIELERTQGWQQFTLLLKNTATAKQAEAMKSTDATTLARAFGYMAACLDACNLPSTMTQHLEAQLQSLTRSEQS